MCPTRSGNGVVGSEKGDSGRIVGSSDIGSVGDAAPVAANIRYDGDSHFVHRLPCQNGLDEVLVSPQSAFWRVHRPLHNRTSKDLKVPNVSLFNYRPLFGTAVNCCNSLGRAGLDL